MIAAAFNNFLKSQSRAIYLSLVLAVLAGLVGLNSLASGIYPEVIFPRVVVLVEAGDSAAQLLLPGVTRPIEESVSKIPGFRQIRSQTMRGSVEISVIFSDESDIEMALQQVRGRVGELRANFPPNSNLTIERLTPSVYPVLSYNLIGDNIPLPRLNDLAIDQIRPCLLQVPGVAQLKIQSARSREYAVEVDPQRLAALHLSLAQIAQAIQTTNLAAVVGRSVVEKQQALIMASGELFNANQLKEIVATSRGGTPITLGQIASVHEGTSDAQSAFSGSGKTAVLLSVLKQPNGNLLTIAAAVNKELASIGKQLPVGVRVEPVYDLAQLVEASIDNLRDAIAAGVVLIFVVIFLFLRDWRSTLIAALTIPVTVCITFGAMALGHQTLNLMSLGGLAVAIGLIIDDAIVMIEGIFHNVQNGLGLQDASEKAVGDLSGAVISSTLTTIVVFAPLGLLQGVVGQFFTSFCFTLTASVLISLLLALTLTPVMCRRFLKIKPQQSPLVPKSSIGFANVRAKIQNVFQETLAKLLHRPVLIMVAAALITASLWPLAGQLESGFMPDIDEGSFVLDYYAPAGTSLSDTDKIAFQIEDILKNTPAVASWSRRTSANLALSASETSMGDILVRLKSLQQRKQSTQAVIAVVREKLDQKLPGIDIELTQILQDLINDLADSPAPIAIKIFGKDEAILKAISTTVGKRLEAIPGLVDINTHVRPSAAERTIVVDPVEAGRFGLTTADIILQVQTALLGITATSVREQEKLVPVRLRYSDQIRKTYSEDPAAMPIFNTAGNAMPLKGLAKISLRPGSLAIRRENLARLDLVTARLEGRDLGSAMDAVQPAIAKIALPPGYYITYGGQWASQQMAFANLSLVLALAILLVYLVLVIQFRSLTTPAPILVAIPLSLFGVFSGLWMTHTPLNISSFMGIILLVGLVVKNGIILLTRADQNLAAGVSLEEALNAAVQDRLRPILMTTICTVLGLLPLALGIGSGAEMQKPLAIAVIAGLSLATVITLVATPAFYLLIHRLKNKNKAVTK